MTTEWAPHPLNAALDEHFKRAMLAYKLSCAMGEEAQAREAAENAENQFKRRLLRRDPSWAAAEAADTTADLFERSAAAAQAVLEALETVDRGIRESGAATMNEWINAPLERMACSADDDHRDGREHPDPEAFIQRMRDGALEAGMPADFVETQFGVLSDRSKAALICESVQAALHEYVGEFVAKRGAAAAPAGGE